MDENQAGMPSLQSLPASLLKYTFSTYIYPLFFTAYIPNIFLIFHTFYIVMVTGNMKWSFLHSNQVQDICIPLVIITMETSDQIKKQISSHIVEIHGNTKFSLCTKP